MCDSVCTSMHVWICECECACAPWRLWLAGNPSKLIIISKHDRVDKMSCAPPDLLSNHKPYLWWWTDVALAWTNQRLSVRVGVYVWAHKNTHIKRRTHVDTQTQQAHTQVTFNTALISFCLSKEYFLYSTWKVDLSRNHKWADPVMIHIGIYSCYLLASVCWGS